MGLFSPLSSCFTPSNTHFPTNSVIFESSFIHYAHRLATGPLPRTQPSPRQCDLVRPFNFRHTVVSLKQNCRCLFRLPRLPVISTLPSVLPSITYFRRQLPRDMWAIQLAFLLWVSEIRKIFLSSLVQSNKSFFSRSVKLTFSNRLQHNI